MEGVELVQRNLREAKVKVTASALDRAGKAMYVSQLEKYMKDVSSLQSTMNKLLKGSDKKQDLPKQMTDASRLMQAVHDFLNLIKTALKRLM